jgi:hypothetical protein
VGVGDGTAVVGGRVAVIAEGVERLVFVAGDAPQPTSKHRLRSTNIGTERGFIRSLSFLLAEKATVTQSSESSAMSLAHLRAYATDGDMPTREKPLR